MVLEEMARRSFCISEALWAISRIILITSYMYTSEAIRISTVPKA